MKQTLGAMLFNRQTIKMKIYLHTKHQILSSRNGCRNWHTWKRVLTWLCKCQLTILNVGTKSLYQHSPDTSSFLSLASAFQSSQSCPYVVFSKTAGNLPSDTKKVISSYSKLVRENGKGSNKTITRKNKPMLNFKTKRVKRLALL